MGSPSEEERRARRGLLAIAVCTSVCTSATHVLETGTIDGAACVVQHRPGEAPRSGPGEPAADQVAAVDRSSRCPSAEDRVPTYRTPRGRALLRRLERLRAWPASA